MSSESQLIERALKVSSSCLLSPLPQCLDQQPIGREDFTEFRLMLDDQLHLLLDILYQNRNLLIEQAHDNEFIQLRANIVLLTCEQTEPNPYFQTEQTILIASLSKLLYDNFCHFDNRVIQNVLQDFKEKLKRDCWKKQLGKIHAFPKFCEIILKERPEAVNGDALMFMLSVGSNLVWHHDPHYKTIGLKVYRHIVELGKKALLKEMNIHEVIFSESFALLRKCSEIEYNDHLYEVLHNVIKIEDAEVINSNWCKFDDVMDEILEQFGIENDNLSRLILRKIVQICGVSQFEVDVLREDATIDETTQFFEVLKSKTRINYRTMRWINKLTQMMIRESSRLLSNSRNSFVTLNLFHQVYIVTIFNLEPSVLDQQLSDFTRKFVLILMRVVNTFKEDDNVKSAVKCFLETIESHQKSDAALSRDLQALLSHELLK